MTAISKRIGPYGAILRMPGVPVPVAGTVLSSLPIGMLGLAMLLQVRASSGGFATAGTVVAVFGIGTGLGIVSQGRLIDRCGPKRVLLVAAGCQSAALILIATLPGVASVPWQIGTLAFIAGLAEPQSGGALRSMWPALVDMEHRAAASAMSSILFELAVVTGPLLLTVLLRVSNPRTCLLVAGGLSAVGTTMVARSRAALNWHAAGDGRRSIFGPLAIPRIRMVAGITAAQGAAVGLLQVSCAAVLTEHSWPGGTGLLYSLLSLGSLVGTAVYGLWSRPIAPWWQLPLLLLALSGALIGAAFAPGIVILCGWVLAVGLLVGPVSVRCFTDAERETPPGSLAAAATTLTATGLAATSSGTALAGKLTDAAGTTASLVTAAACTFVAAFTVTVGVRVQKFWNRTARRTDSVRVP